MKKIFSNPYNIIVLLVLIGVIILRFYRVADFFNFSLDEEYQAHLARTITNDFHIIWIGVNASNIGYYLGPGFTYLNALLFYISKNDPVILGFFSSFFGVLTTISLYIVCRDLWNKKIALIASILYGFSALMVFYDRRFWNPTPLPFIAIWMIYSLIKAQKDTRWFILSAILMASSYHFHISFWVYWPVFIFMIIKLFKKIHWKTWMAMIVAHLVITFPLSVFNYVHNFDNMLMPIRLLTQVGTKQTFNLLAHIQELLSSFGRIWFIQPFGSITDESVPGAMLLKSQGHLIFSILTISIIVWFITKSAKISVLRSRVGVPTGEPRAKYDIEHSDSILPIKLTLIFYILAFLFYPGGIFEYYLLGFFPVFFIIAAILLSKLKLQILIPILILFVLINSFTVFTTSDAFGLTNKKKLIQATSNYLNKDFELTTSGTYKSFGGWRYLFTVYGKTPSQSQADEYFGWLYPTEIKSEKPPLKVVITDQIIKNQPILKIIPGTGYKAYIIKN